MKKFSVMKNTSETAKIPKNPSRPTTPAPADCWLAASALRLTASKNPEVSLRPVSGGWGWTDLAGCWAIEIRLLLGHALNVSGVVVDCFLENDADPGCQDQRGTQGEHHAQAPLLLLGEGRVEELGEPNQAAAEGGAQQVQLLSARVLVGQLLQDFLRGAQQHRLLRSRG